MSSFQISKVLKYGGKKTTQVSASFSAVFNDGTWGYAQPIYGGYGGWYAGSGYQPCINGNMLQWQSTTNWYYGYIFCYWDTSNANRLNLGTGVISGSVTGYLGTTYHTQGVGYTIYSSGVSYTYDSNYAYPRNTTGISISVQSLGDYYGTATAFRFYQNNVLLGTLAQTSGDDGYYTIQYLIDGTNLYAAWAREANASPNYSLSLISSSVNQSLLTGREIHVMMGSNISNDQGETCYGTVNYFIINSLTTNYIYF